MKSVTSLVCLMVSLVGCFPVSAAVEQLLDHTRSAYTQQQKENQQREAAFKQTEAELTARKQVLKKRIAELQAESARLAEQFNQNEKRLAEKEQALHLATGSLGELFGVVRQVAKELQVEMNQSVAAIGQEQQIALVNQIVAAETLPSSKQLQGLWHALTEQIQASGRVTRVKVDFVQGDGVHTELTAKRLGSIGLLSENGYLQWQGNSQSAVAYHRQPESTPTSTTQFTGRPQSFAVDPSRGKLLEQLANEPTLSERFKQSGVVGQIIVGLLLLGGFIGLVRGAQLMRIRAQVRAQLKHPAQPGDNPLGRVLQVYREEQTLNVEALELRLLEAVVAEQQQLEKGLSLIKLFAALAPMLGLLGTVTGMIETFQTITQFGNADPRVMAGGISMALVTTVLGLIAAMPLLLLHNILSSQAEHIHTVIEKQGIGLVAERAEQNLEATA